MLQHQQQQTYHEGKQGPNCRELDGDVVEIGGDDKVEKRLYEEMKCCEGACKADYKSTRRVH